MDAAAEAVLPQQLHMLLPVHWGDEGLVGLSRHPPMALKVEVAGGNN